MKRRKRRTVKSYKKNSVSKKIISFLVVVSVSVAAGYMTATYVLGPLLELDMQPASFDLENVDKENYKEKENTEKKTVIEEKVIKYENRGYALQYGSYSTEEGAKECIEDLSDNDIDAAIIEKDGMYKVIGKVYETKEEARNCMDNISQSSDVFITEIP